MRFLFNVFFRLRSFSMKVAKVACALLLVALMASFVQAQQPGGGGAGGGGRGGRGAGGGRGGMFTAPPAYDKLVAADIGFKEGDPVTAAVLAKYLKKNLPEGAPEGAAKRVPLNAVMTFARVVDAAGGDPLTATSATKEDWAKGIAAMPQPGAGGGRGQGGGRRGGGNGGNGGNGGGAAPQT
jgi:hypothetical protein